MKRYYIYNSNETKEIYIGKFKNDEDFWKEYISAINQKRLDDESNRLKALDKANLEKKKAEFERLKSELGYS